MRGSAFKYEIKAADQAISRGAFSDGLVFLEAAHKLALTKPELKVLSDVIGRALRDLGPISTGNAKIAASVRKVTERSFRSSAMAAHPASGKQKAYLAMQAKVQAQLDKIANNQKQNVLGGNRNGGDAKLTWQPSYVASRMSEHSECDDDQDTPRTAQQKKQRMRMRSSSGANSSQLACCAVS